MPGEDETRSSLPDDIPRAKVLVVDDVPVNLALVQAIVEPLDCDVVAVQSGWEALTALGRESFAVLLLDVQMPGMDGYEVARRVRSMPEGRELPIIFMTASAYDDENVVRGYHLGAVDFLFRPIDPAILNSKVRVFVDLFRSRAHLARTNQVLERAYAEVKATQAQLVQSAKMASLGTLVAGIAHELNNPLSYCLSHVGTALGDVSRIQDAAAGEDDVTPSCERAIQRLTDTQSGLLRMHDLVLKLRTFSRMDEGEVKAVSVRDSIQAVVHMLEHRFRGRLLVTTAFEAPEMLECRAGLLNQAVMNLIANAIDAIEGEGTIHIACGADGEGKDYVIQVIDSGPGVPAEHLERVFEPFFTTKAVGAGTGLGLSISYAIAEAHGGTLTLRNGERGAVATLRIPLG